MDMEIPIPRFDYGDTVFAVVPVYAERGHAEWRVHEFVVDTIEIPSIVFEPAPDPVLYNGIEAGHVFEAEWEAQLECHKRNPEKTVIIESRLPGRCLDCDMLDDTMLCRAAGRFAESEAEKKRASFCPMRTDCRMISEKTYGLLERLYKQIANDL